MAMARIYATACEKDGKNFNTVPDKPKGFRAKVEGIIKADGFIIQDDGTVVRA